MSPPGADRPDDFSFGKDTLTWLSKADPALRDRVLAMLDAEAHHRRELETAALRADIADTRRGQYCGLAVGLASIAAGALTSAYGSAVAGATIGGVGVVALATASVFGRSARPRSLRRPRDPSSQAAEAGPSPTPG